MDLARETNIGWIRIEPANADILKIISAGVSEASPQL